MKTEETNKLIAEFLNELTTNSEGQVKEDLEKLDFHYNWNSLMRAIEKIRKFHNGTEPLSDKQIEQLLQLIKKLNESLTLRNEVSIEAVYNACVTFIEWYNSGQKK